MTSSVYEVRLPNVAPEGKTPNVQGCQNESNIIPFPTSSITRDEREFQNIPDEEVRQRYEAALSTLDSVGRLVIKAKYEMQLPPAQIAELLNSEGHTEETKLALRSLWVEIAAGRYLDLGIHSFQQLSHPETGELTVMAVNAFEAHGIRNLRRSKS